MNTEGQLPVSEPLRSTAIPIAQISPETEGISDCSVHAVVTLIWPYSSSNRSLSLLVAEPDFRLRRTNGQVKLVFHGHVAEAVAKSQVGNGDHMFVGLAGSRFVSSETSAQAPGKSVPWEIHFDDRVLLEIWRSSNHFSTVKIDRPPTPIQDAEDTVALPATPTTSGLFRRPDSILGNGLKSWRSPAFVERTRTSFGGLVDSAYDPFAEEDGYIPGKGRKRLRFSLRGADWRVIDEPASPGDKEVPADWTWMFEETESHESDTGAEDQVENAVVQQAATMAGDTVSAVLATTDSAMDVDDGYSDIAMKSPEQPIEQIATPNVQGSRNRPLNVPGFFRQQIISESDSHLPTDTPRLYPIPSPGLPVPSPLITTSNNTHSYFSPIASSALVTSVQAIPSDSPVDATVTENTAVQSDIAMAQEAGLPSELVAETINAPSEPQDFAVQFQPLSFGTSAVTADATLSESTELATQQSEDFGTSASTVEVIPSDATEIAEAITEEIQHIDAEAALEEDSGEQNTEIRDRVVVEASDEESSEREYAEENTAESSEAEIVQVGEVDSDEEEEEKEAEELEQESGEESPEASGVSENESGDEPLNDERQPEIFPQISTSQGSHPKHLREAAESDVEELAGETRDEIEEDSYSETGSEESSFKERELGEEIQHGVANAHHNADGFEDEDDDKSEEEAEEEEEEEEEEIEETSDLQDEQDTYEDDYDQMESDYNSESDMESPVRPQKTVHPEVIVLDSDSEDEASTGPIEHAPAELTADESSPSAAEYDVSDRVPTDSEAEEWSEDEVELIEYDQAGDEQEEAEFVQDRPVPSEAEEDQEMEDVPPDNDTMGGEQVGSRKVVGQDEELAETAHIQSQSSYDAEETPRSRSEALQAMESSSRSPESLDDLQNNAPAVVSTSAGYTLIPPTQDPPIDPELARVEDSQDVALDVKSKDETEARLTGFDRESASGPSFDGAASPRSVENIARITPQVIIKSQPAQQFATPDASQVTLLDQAVSTYTPMEEILPTPQHTQKTSHDLGSEHEAYTAASDQSTMHISTEFVENDVSLEKEYNFEMSSTLVEQPEQDQSQEVFLLDAEHVMSSVETEPQPIQRWDGTEAVKKASSPVVDRYYPGLRSKYSYFTPLATLIDHFNSLTDTISIVTEALPLARATSGKKDFMVTLQLTDLSMAGTTIVAQIFRPYKTALPSVGEGDAILLRNFQVKSFNHSMMLVSTDTSAWAVFNGSDPEPQIAGPPVEYGDEEISHASKLRQWYYEDGIALVADHQLQAAVARSRELTPFSSAAPSEAGSIDSTLREGRGESSVSQRGSRRRKSHRRITIHELRDGRRYTEVGSPSDKESIHELRDGTVYANL